MHYTIYRITNKLSGKIYIGSHKTTNLDDNYMGSSKYLKMSIEKNGIENFEKETLFVFDNPEDMYAKEAELVNEDFVAEANTYNLKVGGFGGWDYVNANLTEDRTDARKKGGRNYVRKMQEQYGVSCHFQLDYVRHRISESNKRRHAAGEMFIPDTTGFKHTEETKRAMSEERKGHNNTQYGTMWITNGKENRKINKNVDTIPEGWYRGRIIKPA